MAVLRRGAGSLLGLGYASARAVPQMFLEKWGLGEQVLAVSTLRVWQVDCVYGFFPLFKSWAQAEMIQ